MNIQPVTLEGTRVSLIPMEPKHAEELFQAAQCSEIWAFMPTKVQTQENMETFVRVALDAQREGHELPFVIYDSTLQKVVGSTRYMEISVPNRHLEIGWTWLSPDVWRTRVNTECKYLLLKHAFESLDAIRVQLKTDSRNVRSQQAIERIGGKREGVLRKHRILPDGYIRDSVYFSIIDSEWPDARERLESLLQR